MTSKRRKPGNRRKVAIVTLGCPKNEIDSEKLAAMLVETGADLALPEQAEVIIVNTCGFIESAKQESINTVLELAVLKTSGSCKSLIVTGCLAERYKDQLASAIPEADEIIGLDPKAVVAAVSGRILRSRRWQEPLSRVRMSPAHWAYLRIGEGCDNRCSYCAIPLIRGRLRSRPMKEILAEARVLAGSGAKEICLIAQDTTAYGREDGGAPKLHKLLQQLERIEDIKWIRLLYTHPAHFYPELIETMAESEKVCRYLDVPLQHVNDRILADMRRRVSKADIETLLEKLRERLPGLTLRTTFIVGFPGETRAKFKELMRFVEKWRFERLGAFVYSPEEDTKAAEFDRQVGGRTKKSRYDELMTLQQAIALDLGEARTGSRELVLVDAPPGEDAFQSARSEAEAPDIDPVIFVKSTGRGIEAGCFTEVKITGIRGYDLEAVPARSRKRLKGESESS